MGNRFRRWTSQRVAARGIGRFLTSALLVSLLAASSGGLVANTAAAKSPRASKVGGTLTFGGPALVSLDPEKSNNGALGWPVYLAYDSLTRMEPNGRLAPDLATSWRYVGKGNKQFEITLRKGVRFSDGSPLTVEGLKAWFTYFKNGSGAFSGLLSGLATIKVTGPLTVRLLLSQPNPLLPRYFDQDYLMGDVASAKALKNPDQLGTRTVGAGEYMVDPSSSVTGDHYTLVPNPYYWNKRAVHWHKIVYRVIANQTASLQALRTGQIAVAPGDFTTANAAEGAGLKVIATPVIFQGLIIADRGGTVLKPLADVRVRQALNYAIDRKAITRGLFGKWGTPTDEIGIPGQDGWVAKDASYYTYNPRKAKNLLAAAGYGSGFTLPLLTTSIANQDLLAQAVASDLQKVGVKAQLTNDSDPNKFFSDLASQKYPAMTTAYGGALPMYIEYVSLFGRPAFYNPFHSTDAQVESLNTTGATASPAKGRIAYQRLEHRLLTLAWFAPVVLTPEFAYVRSDVVAGVKQTSKEPLPEPVDWYPAH
jgi:peptide/nickel transport system substrate-binding protein